MSFQPYWVALLTPLLLRWLLIHAQASKARRARGAAIFRSPGVAVICGAGCAMALFIVIVGWNQNAHIFTTVGGTTWFVFCLWMWPATIVLDSSSVMAKHIWRPTRVIPYSDIEYVTRMVDGQTVVYGNGKESEIRVSQYHAAPAELESELRKRGVEFFR